MSSIQQIGFNMKDGGYTNYGDTALEPTKYGEDQELHPEIESMEVDFTNQAQNDQCCLEYLEDYLADFKAPEGQEWVVTGYLCTATCELQEVDQ